MAPVHLCPAKKQETLALRASGELGGYVLFFKGFAHWAPVLWAEDHIRPLRFLLGGCQLLSTEQNGNLLGLPSGLFCLCKTYGPKVFGDESPYLQFLNIHQLVFPVGHAKAWEIWKKHLGCKKDCQVVSFYMSALNTYCASKRAQMNAAYGKVSTSVCWEKCK